MAETNRDITPELSKERLEGTFPGDLGFEIVSVSDEQAVGRVLVDKRHLHPYGYVHGGVWVAFGDTVAAWGTYRHLEAGKGFTTAELKCNVFAAAKPGDELIAVARPLHVGRRTQVWEVRISMGDKLAAFFSCTQMVL